MGNFPSYDLKMFLSFKGVDNENGFPHTFLHTNLCVHKTVTDKKKQNANNCLAAAEETVGNASQTFKKCPSLKP